MGVADHIGHGEKGRDKTMKRNQRCLWTIAFGGALWGVLTTSCSSLPVDPDGDGNSEPADCDNNDATVNPDAQELCGNETDENCDGQVNEDCDTPTPTPTPGTPTPTPPCDVDGDGWCAPEDCNEEDPNIHPGATESCNGLDNDCDGTLPTCWGQAEWGVWSWLKTMVGI